jgi:translocation and assembly module TamA
VSYLADPLADFPPSIRFFAGGDQSVRAFSYQSLGPKNAQGQVVGGRDLLVGSIELERALFQNWGVSLFHDAGNAFNSFTNVHLYQGAGIGLHYYTPVGGLHLDLAKRLETSKQIYYIHFNVGFQF